MAADWEPSQIIPGDRAPLPDAPAFDEGQVRSFLQLGAALGSEESAVQEAEGSVAQALGNENDAQALARAVLEAAPAFRRAVEEAATPKDVITTLPLSAFAAGLFPNAGDVTADEVASAARGFMYARASVPPGDDLGGSLPSLRLHWFFRNIEGLWACTQPGCQCEGVHADGARTLGRAIP